MYMYVAVTYIQRLDAELAILIYHPTYSLCVFLYFSRQYIKSRVGHAIYVSHIRPGLGPKSCCHLCGLSYGSQLASNRWCRCHLLRGELQTVKNKHGIQPTPYPQPGICETTAGIKPYSGFVTLPYTNLQPYSQETFWFFESRNAPEDAPLAIWLQGGPGNASANQALRENGLCLVQADSNSTV
ncbi:uncharacterized protein BCR38DRAFT_415985 [Pseudomassariella vexata]|uniref:Alpha/Beta hydrolase protein n=1 Tax=Pseudomassariella vexata TaxID=1141098 RepID=A0A1Y2EIS0_9PEZI|nr:uncharacterized protein BCR38DRAFT_415985 [Pseudomassariella vexata]ORY71126.1 hypothetical protein BCR38DRAFT_415985 [Pseudomassariella vexata]